MVNAFNAIVVHRSPLGHREERHERYTAWHGMSCTVSCINNQHRVHGLKKCITVSLYTISTQTFLLIP